MRLRILELPTEHDGDKMTTPFALVVDDVSEEQAEGITPDRLGDLGSTIGARGTLVFKDRVDLE